MLQVTSRTTDRQLTEKQAKFVAAYLAEPNARKAALAAGYEHSERGYDALHSPTVQKAIAEARDRQIVTEGATLAYQTLVDCMKPGNPGSVRVAAAKVVWQAAGVLDKNDKAADRPLNELTADELEARIAALDQVIEAKGRAAKPAKPAQGADIEG